METSASSFHHFHLKDYLYILNKRKAIAIAFFIFVAALVIVYIKTTTPIYKATANVLIEKESPNVVNFEEVLQLGSTQLDYYQTQIEILKSKSLAKNVVEQLDLNEQPFFKESIDAPADLLNIIEVKPVRNSMLLTVSTYLPDPELAAKITNAIVGAYIRLNIDHRLAASRFASDWITKRLQELKVKVSESEKKLQAYKEKHRLITVPSITDENPRLRDMNTELIKLETLHAEYQKRYLEEHPKLIQVVNQIAALKRKLKEEVDQTLEFNQIAIEYAQLEREADSNTRVYNELLKRLKETVVTEDLNASNVIVVDPAEVPSFPAKPRKLLLLILGFGFGVLGAVFLVFGLEYLDSSLKNPEEIERFLGLRFLGIIPQFSKNKKLKNPDLFVCNDPHSTISEAVRSIRTSILFSSLGKPAQVILISSSNPAEGKTFLAGNLAAAIALQNKKTLLIDTDLRKPKAHQLFETTNSQGLTNCLVGQDVSSAIKETCCSGLFFLPSGAIPPNPSELLGSDAMKHFLERARKEYDAIIMDASPFMAVTDPVVLSRLVDGVILIVNSRKANRKSLQRGKHFFEKAGAKILGVVMNRVNVQKESYYYGHYYHYGYGKQKPRSPKTPS